MDVVLLDSNYKPDRIIEGWSSMIWTERHSGQGEFAMTTPLISESRALIPEGSFISLLDSEEVMQVELHSIEPNEDGGVLNTITGATFPSNFLSERDTLGEPLDTTSYPSNWILRMPYSPAEAVAGLLWGYLVDNTHKFMGPAEDLNGDPMGGSGDPLLRIPNLEITTTDIQFWVDPEPGIPDPDEPIPAGTRKWVMDRGTLDRPVFDLLAQGKLGLRTRRPTKRLANPIRFNFDGSVVHDSATIGTKLRVDVYQGRDLTNTVTFRYDAGQVEKPKYLYSIRGYKNVAFISSAQGALKVYSPGTSPSVSGINRRVLSFDVGDLGDLDPEGNFVEADWNRILTQKALTELEKYNKVALFDGEISPLNAIKYGKDYQLGDKVTLQAEYNLDAKMVISEYIRSQDENGETGYPTLSLVED